MVMETVVIAGATGFIGRWFIEKYRRKYKIIALTRRKIERDEDPSVEWRQVDLYSLSSTTNALEGADYALYLVHSMKPSARLNQGTFDDTDLLLADNFARAAEANRLKHIVFIGGILPTDTNKLSRHLRSRYEVEQTLATRKTPLTSLRAGIIVGPGGSSFTIIEKLVKRLPVMFCPKWTQSQSQPISLDDTLTIIDKSFGNEAFFNQSVDIGSPEVMTYVDMLKTTARILKKKRYIFTIPFFSLGMSKLWVGVFSDSHPTFVSPLVESLRHNITINRDQKILNGLNIRYQSFESAVLKSVKSNKLPKIPAGQSVQPEKNTVRSFQRLHNPKGKDAIWVANSYQLWLPKFFKYLVRVKTEGDLSQFHLLWMKQPLLKMKYIPDRSDNQRQLFFIVGGLLVKRSDYGWLEFRQILKGESVIAAIHEFVPTLPWFIYVNTQAIAHLWVMKNFGKYLKKLNLSQ